MKIFIPISVFMLLAGTLFAATPAKENGTGATQEASQQEKQAESSKPKTPAPAATFTPSEKVGADSAVSFPVDI